MDADSDPSALKTNTASRAVNRIFRGGRNYTRPPFLHKPFIFEVDQELVGDARQFEELIKYGNFQGWMPYSKKKPGREDGIVVAIAGHIFFLTLVNEKMLVRLVCSGNDPYLLHTWFVQAEEWVYIQNGKDRPWAWNGLFPSTARRSDPSLNEMPVGTIMAYCYGRVFVSNAFDQVVASDIIYGNKLTDSSSTFKFIETTYWAGGGYFGQPSNLGHIYAMVVMPRQDQSIVGQGELVVISENGAYAIEAGQPRLTWTTARVQTLTLSGRGCVAPESAIVVNNDIWFRSDDGLSSYQTAKQEQKRQWSFSKVSKHVNRWFQTDTPWLTRFTSALYFDNRILTTVSPFMSQPKSNAYGAHRYFRGMVALDLDQAADVQGDSDFNWDGLWTGIRPAGLVKLGNRAYAFSYDSDGTNRIYELSRHGIHDEIEGSPVQVQSFYLTRRFDWREVGSSNEFEVKRLVGGELWISDVHDRISIGADFRPDNIQCWTNVFPPMLFGSDFTGEFLFSLPRYKRFKFPSPPEKCLSGAPYPINHGSQHQLMVFGEGYFRVDRVRIAMAKTNDPNSPVGDCGPDDPKIAIDNNCKLDDDYSYDLAASR
jgi:hypothetical protein